MTISSNGKPSRVFFKYKRLQDYCYLYGLLRHTLRDCAENCDDCNEEEGGETKTNNYGSWLRASPLKKQTKSGMGHSSITSRKKLIFKPEGNAASSSSGGQSKATGEESTGADQGSGPDSLETINDSC